MSFITCYFFILVTTSVFEFCHNLRFKVLSQFDILELSSFSSLVLSQLKCLSFVTIWVFEFSHKFEFLGFVTIWYFEIHQSLSFWVFFSQVEILRFVQIWVFEFRHNLSFWYLSQFEFESLVKILSFRVFHILSFCVLFIFQTLLIKNKQKWGLL